MDALGSNLFNGRFSVGDFGMSDVNSLGHKNEIRERCPPLGLVGSVPPTDLYLKYVNNLVTFIATSSGNASNIGQGSKLWIFCCWKVILLY